MEGAGPRRYNGYFVRGSNPARANISVHEIFFLTFTLCLPYNFPGSFWTGKSGVRIWGSGFAKESGTRDSQIVHYALWTVRSKPEWVLRTHQRLERRKQKLRMRDERSGAVGFGIMESGLANKPRNKPGKFFRIDGPQRTNLENPVSALKRRWSEKQTQERTWTGTKQRVRTSAVDRWRLGLELGWGRNIQPRRFCKPTLVSKDDN